MSRPKLFQLILTLVLCTGVMSGCSEKNIIQSVSSDTTSASDSDGTDVKKPQIHQISAEKKTERESFREATQEKRETVKSQMEARKETMNENVSARKALCEKLKAIKESGEELDSAILEHLKDYNAQIKALNEDIKSTKGSIKTIVDGKIKSLAETLDYGGLENAYGDIETIQSERNVKIAQITEIINFMLALIQ